MSDQISNTKELLPENWMAYLPNSTAEVGSLAHLFEDNDNIEIPLIKNDQLVQVVEEEKNLDRRIALGIPHAYLRVEDLVNDLKAVAADPHQPIKARHRLQAHQTEMLTKAFSVDPNPDTASRSTLAMQLNMNEREVQVWFQNRRAKIKRESTVLSRMDSYESPKLTLKRNKPNRIKKVRQPSKASSYSSTDPGNDTSSEQRNDLMQLPMPFPLSNDSESLVTPPNWNWNQDHFPLTQMSPSFMSMWSYESLLQHVANCPHAHPPTAGLQPSFYLDNTMDSTYPNSINTSYYPFHSNTSFL